MASVRRISKRGAVRYSLAGYCVQEWMHNVPLYAVFCKGHWSLMPIMQTPRMALGSLKVSHSGTLLLCSIREPYESHFALQLCL